MAKKDRTLSVAEILAGKFDKEYLDLKERKAVIKRHIGRLAEARYDLEDKIELCGMTDERNSKMNALNEKIDKLNAEYEEIVLQGI